VLFRDALRSRLRELCDYEHRIEIEQNRRSLAATVNTAAVAKHHGVKAFIPQIK
jgi:hypothetical protein